MSPIQSGNSAPRTDSHFVREIETMRRHIEQLQNSGHELSRREEMYREMVQSANSIILCWNSAGCITFFNRFAQTFFGYSESEVLGCNVLETIVPPDDASGMDLAALMTDICAHPERYENNENENVRKNGQRVWIAWTNKPLYDSDGRFIEILSVGNDITRRKQAEDELLRMATIDPLTDALNRRAGQMKLKQLMSLAQSNGQPLVVGYVDVNGLKTVNDQHGHQEGDELIQLTSHTLRSALRKSDLFCRLGGDEFLIILPKTTLAAAEEVWLGCLSALMEFNATGTKPYPLSVSHGFALYDPAIEPEISPQEIVSRADQIMYQEKTALKAREGAKPR